MDSNMDFKIIDLKLVKEYLRKMEQIVKEDHYKEFEVALLIYECSNNLSEEQITGSLVNTIYSVSSLKENLIDCDLSQSINVLLETTKKFTKNIETTIEEEEETDYER